MRIVHLLLAALLLAAPALAQSQADQPQRAPARENDKIFDDLFGDEPARVTGTRGPRAGRDDLSIVALHLGRYQLLESLPAYSTPAGLCLPLLPVLDALEIGHAETAGQQVIELHAPERRVPVPAADLTPSPDGPCLAIAAFARLLPVTVRHDEANLRISMDASEPLPVIARLDRAERRRQALRGAEPARPQFPRIANPWGLAGLPTIDLALAGEAGSRGGFLAGQAEMIGDLAGMTARARLAGDSNGQTSIRLALGRDSEAADQLGFLHARSFAVGDVNAPAQPLIGVASSGRGIVISNRPTWRADLFDQIELRGPLPRGWDAELHRDDRLVAVFDTPDASGDYVFANVPLRAGANNYVVRLFGPHGEIEERPFSRFVGSELNPENEWVYSAGVVDSGVPLLGPPAPTQTALGKVAFATVEHGISGGVSMRFDVRAPLDGGGPALAAGVHAALLGGFGSLLVAGDGGGRPAVALRGVRQWGRTNIRFDIEDYGDLNGPSLPSAVSELAREFGISAETRVALGRRSLPLLTGWRHSIDRGGNRLDRVDASLALALGEWRFSHGASLEQRSGDAPIVLGNMAVARAVGNWRLRGGIDISASDGLRLRQIGLSAGRASLRGNLGVDLGWDAQRGIASITATAQRHFGGFSLGAGAGYGMNGWRIGLSLAAALFPDRRGYHLAAAGIGRSGTLQPHVFEDVDGDGVQGPGEPDIAGASFIVDSSVRREATASDGRVRIGGLMPNSRVDMEVQLASLPDLRLRPVQPGLTAVVRPGQVLDVAVPLRQTGEIEAQVETVNGDVRRPLPGIEVALVDAAGKRFAVTRSDFEGLAYFDGVPPGDWRLEAAHAAPVPVTLSAETLLVSDARIIVGR
jgi:hypothetical protein